MTALISSLPRKKYLTLLLPLAFALSLPGQAISKSALPEDLSDISITKLQPTKQQQRTSVNILDQLNYAHYQELAIDDQLSSRVFDRYLKELDPTKVYFLSGDIKEFEKYRYSIDNALKAGNLNPGFEIYNRYQKRVIERLVYVVNLLEQSKIKFDFNKKDYLDTERENADWVEHNKDLDKLWKQRLKGAILSLKLAGKTQEDAIKQLSTRYRSQLNRSLQVNAEDAFQTYINALAQTYDPHTLYFSPRSSENFNINMSLRLEGIGAVLQTENEFTKVVRLVPAGPADKSGQLHPADRIIGVAQGEEGDMEDVVGWRIDEVVDRIRGPKDSLVRLQVIPHDAASDSETKEINIVRNTVELEDQAAKSDIIEIQQGSNLLRLGVINLPTFYVDFRGMQNRDPNYRSTTRDVKKLITQLNKDHVDGIILDLRNNGGGSLEEVNKLLGLFISTGPTVQVQDDRGNVEMLKDRDPSVFYDGPLAVIVNRLSASASEIFAGAIQDYGRGLVLGTQTFGKGTVQALRSLNRGQLKITQAKFYRISGESNQNLGVIPDIELPSRYDKKEIGESALENALPWDTIRPARFHRFQDLSSLIPEVKSLHSERVKHDPDYEYLVSQIKYMEEKKNRSQLSLMESERLKETEETKKTLLALENERRKKKGLEPLDQQGLEKLESEKMSDEAVVRDDDIILKESSHILADFISLQSRRIAKHP